MARVIRTKPSDREEYSRIAGEFFELMHQHPGSKVRQMAGEISIVIGAGLEPLRAPMQARSLELASIVPFSQWCVVDVLGGAEHG